MPNINPESWKTIIALIDQVRIQKNISKQDLADKVGCKRQHLSRFFALKNEPSIQLVLEVGAAIGLNIFFEDKEGKTDLAIAMEKAMDQLGRTLPKNLN